MSLLLSHPVAYIMALYFRSNKPYRAPSIRVGCAPNLLSIFQNILRYLWNLPNFSIYRFENLIVHFLHRANILFCIMSFCNFFKWKTYSLSLEMRFFMLGLGVS